MAAREDWVDGTDVVNAAELNALGATVNGKQPAGAYAPGGTDVALGDGGTGASLSDPNADRVMFWDDSAGATGWLTPGTNLSISGTTLNAAGGGGGTLDNFDFWAYWPDNSNGAPTTADSGQTYVSSYASGSGGALTVQSGALVCPHTAGGAHAGHLTAPLGNPIKYVEGKYQFSGSGTDTVTIAVILWESVLNSGELSIGSNRSPAHIIFTPTYDGVQTVAPTADVANVDIHTRTTPSGVPQKFAMALDKANNRMIMVYGDGHVAVLTDTARSYFANVDGSFIDQEIVQSASNTDKRGQWLECRASAIIGDDNVEYASKYDMLIAIGKVVSAGGSVGSNLVYAPTPTGVEATDTAAIQAAHDALPSAGGTIWLQPGTYMFSAAGVTFTKKTHLIGAGAATDDASGITVIGMNSLTGTAITVNKEGCILEDFALVNINLGTLTSGAGIRMQKAHSSKISRVWVYNFYDNISYEAGHYWTLTDSIILTPYRYGVRIRNSDSNDSGDMNITGCWFDALGASRNSTSAVRWETGSGLRLLGCKFNGSTYKFDTHVDVAFDAGTTATQNSADVFVQDCSIENAGTTGVKIARAAGSWALYLVQVQNNEFMNCPTFVSIGQSIQDWIVSGNTLLGGASSVGVDVLSGSGAGTVGRNRYDGVITPVRVNSGASTRLTVDRQDIAADGKVFTNAMTGTGVPLVDCSYWRPIDWTVNATPTAVFALLPVNNTGGVVDVTITGTVSSAGFIAGRKFTYTVNGSGVVTIGSDLALVQLPSSNQVITATAATNSIIIKFSTTNAAAVTNGLASIRVDGLVSEFRIGA